MNADFAKAHDTQLASANARIAALQSQCADLACFVVALLKGADMKDALIPAKLIEECRNLDLAVTPKMAAPPKENETDPEPTPEKCIHIEWRGKEQRPRLQVVRG